MAQSGKEKKKEKKNDDIKLDAQKKFIESIKNKIGDDYKKEWKALARPEELPCATFLEQEKKNSKKNRYRSIECIDNERVVLEGPGEAYIHANFIKNLDGKKLFIGTQGPTRDSTPDFWRMVVQEKSTVIIMLCNIFEEDEKDGNIKEKSAQYWPSTVGKSFKYDDLEVSCLEIVEISYGVEGQIIVTTTLELIKSSTKKTLGTVKHVLYKNWPDLSVPTTTEPVLDIYKKFIQSSKTPVVVHCSAGIGRTGCFIAAYYCFDAFKNGELISVQQSVQTLRQMRGRLVQKATQYVFVHLLLIELIENETGAKFNEMKTKVKKMIKILQTKLPKKS